MGWIPLLGTVPGANITANAVPATCCKSADMSPLHW
jgi:hypothetical protein